MINEELDVMHYKEPLKPLEDGHGYLGCLSMTKDGLLVQCHICGALQSNLASHVTQKHKMPAREYKEKFGLAYKTALVSEAQRFAYQQKTLDWLKTLSPEQKEELKRRQREARNHREAGQPKQALETKNKRGTCPDQLLAKIKEVAETLGHTPTKNEFIDATGGQKYKHLIYTTFGSWAKALEMVGMTPNTKNWNMTKHRRYSDDELLEYLVIFAQENNRAPTETDFRRGLLPDSACYRRHFGTIEAARQLAGVYEFIEE